MRLPVVDREELLLEDGELEAHVDTEGDADAEHEGLGDADTDALRVADLDGVAHALGDLVPEEQREGDTVCVGEMDVLRVRVGDAVTDMDAEEHTDAVNDFDSDAQVVTEVEIERERTADRERVFVMVPECVLRECVGDELRELLFDVVGERDGEMEGVPVPLSEGDCEGEGDADGDGEPLALSVTVMEGVPVKDTVVVREPVTVRELLRVGEIDVEVDPLLEMDVVRDVQPVAVAHADKDGEFVGGLREGDMLLVIDGVREVRKDAEEQREGETVAVVEREAVRVIEDVTHKDGVAEAHKLALVESDGVRECVAVVQTVPQRDGDGVLDAQIVDVPLREGEEVAEPLREGDVDVDAEPLTLGDTVNVPLPHTLTLAEGEVEPLADGDADVESLADTDTEPLGLSEADKDTLNETVCEAVVEGHPDSESVGDKEFEKVELEEPVAEDV